MPRLFLGVLCVIALAPSLFAQATFGSLIGTVSDPAGAVVAGAKVTVRSEERGVSYGAVTNESGNYIITQLSVGDYTAEFEAPGFQRLVQKEVRIALGTSTRVDAQLTVGQVTEQVSVTSAAPPLVTDRAEVSTALTSKEIRDLPTLNRNITSLQLLMPGAQRVLGQHASSENPQGGIQINNNGQTFGSTNFMIDGTDNNDPVLGIVIVNPSIDSVEEMKYTGGNFDAEFAQAGGAVIQVETKSGTNQLHGSLFEFLQNNIMNARNPFSEPSRTTASALESVRWLAWRTDPEEQAVRLWRLPGHTPAHRRVSPDNRAYRRQCAVEISARSAERIFDPQTGTPMDGAACPSQTTAFLRTASRRRRGIAYQSAAAPQLRCRPGAINNNFTSQASDNYDADQFDIRVDHYLNDSFRYFSRYSFADFRRVAPAAFGQDVGGPGLSGLLVFRRRLRRAIRTSLGIQLC